jgi:large subunit ribosomal protein L23
MATTTKTTKTATSKVSAKGHSIPGTYAHVLRAPRITEKATDVNTKNGYVFDVDSRATKPEIIKAFQEVYGVKPIAVTVTMIVPKAKMNRGRAGVRAGGKKATVWLKKGDTIEIV